MKPGYAGNRRQGGWLGVCLALGLACAAPPALAAAPSPCTLADARHLLDRAAYGPAPGDVDDVLGQGIEAWLEAQLRPEGLTQPADLEARLASLPTLTLSPGERARLIRLPLREAKRDQDREAKQAARRAEARLLREAQAARLWRAIGGKRQLEAVMTEFWADHFSVHAKKRAVGTMVGDLEERVIRPQALGRFRELLGSVARHPAMLDYLDNWRNSRPSPGRKRFGGLNENYARELLELHTLGVGGGYTQADVGSLALILTGWGFPRRWPAARPGPDDTGFYFDGARHASGDKVLLGDPIPSGGVAEGERALDLLAAHPSTARYLARKLAVRFVGDQPPEELVTAVASAFLGSGGQVAPTLRVLFGHPAFWASSTRGARFKTPYRLVISTHRALGLLPPDPGPVLQALQRLSQPMHGCVTPDGWPADRAAWLNPDAMARRISFVTAASRGAPATPEALTATLGEPFGPLSREAIAAAPRALRLAVMLGAPEFQQH